MTDSREPFTVSPAYKKFASSVVAAMREPVLVLSQYSQILAGSESFFSEFFFRPEDLQDKTIFDFLNGLWELDVLRQLLLNLEKGEDKVQQLNVELPSGKGIKTNVSIGASSLTFPGEDKVFYLLSFQKTKAANEVINYRKLLNEVLSEAPAMICTIKGPEHVFELANEKYLQLVGNRDIIGKSVKEALPEVENQGFIEKLNAVYNSGETYIGKEVPLKLEKEGKLKSSLVDFIYQPIKNFSGDVEGIFVHAIDVTEKVQNRRALEDSEKELRNLIDSVPVIVWLTNPDGEGSYLNKNWYKYTGQTWAESIGRGRLKAVHPEDYDRVEKEFLLSHREQQEFQVSYRLRTNDGSYRWVTDRGRPKYSPKGEFQGLTGSVIDVHEDKLKEQLIREKEHRTRSIVEEATVPTAVYTGKEMRIDLANDAMLNLWGKDRKVIGKTLREALPELEGQPFHELLQNVFTTGEIYWGKEDRVDLMRNGKMETGFYNFTYKPLRDGAGKIYGILNMALNVTEMVESRNLLKEREQHFRLMADLMPEKVINTSAKGEAIYFNQNWLDYTGLTSEKLKNVDWKKFVHPDEQKEFNEKWQSSLRDGSGFEMELRIRNKEGNYLWHLSRAEAVKGEAGEILMWIGTNTQIQKLKEEEKRKGDFLKMVSHELKTPVTSIKGYVQLLLNMLRQEEHRPASALPIKPSLERIDNQIVRLTRLISEMLDLSRLEEQKLELQKEVFNINDLVVQTVQDIQLTNTRHQMEIFHSCRCEVFADKDRIGQVLINFITNAIKYSPESQYIEIHILKVGNDKVAVSVRDKGIGIEEKDQKSIFKRFYRIEGENEDTYSGFGIGLYVANEIIERHGGVIEVKSEKGKGSDFSFILSEGQDKVHNNG
ncbi:PAS domain-containing sensor histidine kinase [Salinimicrobium xinjiangense]|uniref:PAS domain-containing sensor histidine kinase n=1 Tax=Salinimicrobium xinjiangense TaxID=438596 RepID=UPI00041F9B82|nr:PAS domain-containing sensor histidine kinase [Salinimicrobium xinjiangense]